MSKQQHCTKFASLPNEIYHYILNFLLGADRQLLDSDQRKQDMMTLATFQSLSKQINNTTVMQDYYNEFWWRIVKRNFSLPIDDINRQEKLKIALSKKGKLKRRVLLANYMKKSICLKLPLFVKDDESTREDFSSISNGDLSLVVYGENKYVSNDLSLIFGEGIQHFDYYANPTFEENYWKNIYLDDIPVRVVVHHLGDEDFSPDLIALFSIVRDSIIRANSFILHTRGTELDEDGFFKKLHSRVNNIIQIRGGEIGETPIIFSLIDEVDIRVRRQLEEKYKSAVLKLVDEFSLVNTCINNCSFRSGTNVDVLYREALRRNKLSLLDNMALFNQILQYDSDTIPRCTNNPTLVMRNSKESPQDNINNSKKCQLM